MTLETHAGTKKKSLSDDPKPLVALATLKKILQHKSANNTFRKSKITTRGGGGGGRTVKRYNFFLNKIRMSRPHSELSKGPDFVCFFLNFFCVFRFEKKKIVKTKKPLLLSNGRHLSLHTIHWGHILRKNYPSLFSYQTHNSTRVHEMLLKPPLATLKKHTLFSFFFAEFALFLAPLPIQPRPQCFLHRHPFPFFLAALSYSFVLKKT